MESVTEKKAAAPAKKGPAALKLVIGAVIILGVFALGLVSGMAIAKNHRPDRSNFDGNSQDFQPGNFRHRSVSASSTPSSLGGQADENGQDDSAQS